MSLLQYGLFNFKLKENKSKTLKVEKHPAEITRFFLFVCETGSCYVAQAVLELTILFLPPQMLEL